MDAWWVSTTHQLQVGLLLCNLLPRITLRMGEYMTVHYTTVYPQQVGGGVILQQQQRLLLVLLFGSIDSLNKREVLLLLLLLLLVLTAAICCGVGRGSGRSEPFTLFFIPSSNERTNDYRSGN